MRLALNPQPLSSMNRPVGKAGRDRWARRFQTAAASGPTGSWPKGDDWIIEPRHQAPAARRNGFTPSLNSRPG